MEGLDLASRVTTRERYTWGDPRARHIVAYDYGIKRNILRLFAENDCRVTVVPADTSASEALELRPDGIFLSNGPGDPDAIDVRARRSARPRHQRHARFRNLPRTSASRTFVRRLDDEAPVRPPRRKSSGEGNAEWPRAHHSQNHGFAVEGDETGVAGASALEVTHVNLNDGTIEGVRHREPPGVRRSVPPGSGSRPHDAVPHFDEFLAAIKAVSRLQDLARRLRERLTQF